MDFPTKVRKLLKRKGTSQAALARSIGVGAARITEWLDPDDPAKPSIYQLLGMAQFLGCTTDFLLDDSREELPRPETESIVTIRGIIATIGEQEALRRLTAAERPEQSATAAAVTDDLYHSLRGSEIGKDKDKNRDRDRRRKEGA